MHPDARRSELRMHSAEFKAKVLAQCHEHGASVAAAALANDLDANRVHKWLVGRGLGRLDLLPDGADSGKALGVMLPAQTTSAAQAAAHWPFVAVELASPGPDDGTTAEAAGALPADAACIHIVLRRGDTSLAVRWPLPHAQGCTVWLGERSGAVLAVMGRDDPHRCAVAVQPAAGLALGAAVLRAD